MSGLENIRIATAHLESMSPYGQNGYFVIEKKSGETADKAEKRLWRERCHADADGNVFIPAMAFKKCLEGAGRYVKLKVGGGRGQETFTKHFESGIIIQDNIPLGIKKDKIEGHWQLVPASGEKNRPGPRVEKCFPFVQSWNVKVPFWIIDDFITEEALRVHLEAAGLHIGIGAWRPERGGLWGRFLVKKIEWSKAKAEDL